MGKNQDLVIQTQLLRDCFGICSKLDKFVENILKNEKVVKDRFIVDFFGSNDADSIFINVILTCYTSELSKEGEVYKSEIDKLLESGKYKYIKSHFITHGVMDKVYSLIIAIGVLNYFLESIGDGERLNFAIKKQKLP